MGELYLFTPLDTELPSSSSSSSSSSSDSSSSCCCYSRRCCSLFTGRYFGLDDDGYESQVTDECLRKSAHQLPEDGTYQSQLLYTPYTVKMGQLTLYRSEMEPVEIFVTRPDR